MRLQGRGRGFAKGDWAGVGGDQQTLWDAISQQALAREALLSSRRERSFISSNGNFLNSGDKTGISYFQIRNVFGSNMFLGQFHVSGQKQNILYLEISKMNFY